MALTFHYSNCIETLASNLSRRLAEERVRIGDPFVPQVLLVPNSQIGSWLRFWIGGQLGVAANLRTLFLEKGLWELAVQHFLQEESDRYRLLSREAIHLLVLAEFLQSQKLAGVPLFERYLSTPAGLSEQGRTARAWQLAEKVSRLFSHYELQREAMIDNWLSAPPAPAPPKTVEENQRSLYLSIFGPDGTVHRVRKTDADPIPMTLAQLARRFRNGSRRSDRGEENRPDVHLFGFSHLSPFHLRLLFELAEDHSVSIHQFNLSTELWAEGERAMAPESAPDPIAYWGRPGVEFLELFRSLAESHSDRIRVETVRLDPDSTPRETLLGAIQAGVRAPDRTPPDPLPTQDVSLQVVGCPGREREVETVYNSILENMIRDPTLKLTDIAVLVSDMPVYQPILESVFNDPTHGVPFNLSDSTAERDSMFAQGLVKLLALAESRFTRREVFDFLFNPLVREALGVSRERVLAWLKWTDAVNIFEASDSGKEWNADTPFNWRWGFRRLELGRLMETLPHGPEGAIPDFRGIIPYSDLDSEDGEELGAFVSAVHGIWRRASRLPRETRTAAEWIELLEDLTERSLKIPKEFSEENSVREELFRSLRDLEILERLGEGAISFPLLRQFVLGRLNELGSSRGRFLVDGVTLSSMRPLRPIPFRIVYVVGLETGGFPGTAEDTTLDLRDRRREAGDVSTPEGNRCLFLETLMAAGEKIYFTYRNWDLQKDREIAPCSTLEELKRVATHRMGGTPFEESRIPVSGSSPVFFEPQPAWSDVRVNYSNRDRLLALLALRVDGRLEHGAQESVEAWVQNRFPEAMDRDGSEPTSKERRAEMRISGLKSFLENPIEGLIRRRLHLYEFDRDDPGLAEDAPIYSEFPADYDLFTRTLNAAVRKAVESGEVEWKSFFQNLHARKSLAGEVPIAEFEGIDREGFESVLSEMFGPPKNAGAPSLLGFLAAVKGWEFYDILQMGESNEFVPNGFRFPAASLSLESGGEAVEFSLHGSLERVWRNDSWVAGLVLAPLSSANNNDAPSKHVVPLFLFLTALRALETSNGDSFIGDRGILAAVQYKNDFRLWRYRFDSAAAAAYLRGMVEDLEFGENFERLPLKAFETLSKKTATEVLSLLRVEDPDEAALERFREIFDDAFDTAMSPRNNRESDLARVLDAPAASEVYRVAKRRLLSFLDAELVADLASLGVDG